MAHAHICLDCGMDLAGIRAAYDTEYCFLVVQCPSCNRAAVRMRHPLTEWWRRFPGIVCATSTLLIQTFLLFLFTFFTIGACIVGAEELTTKLNEKNLIAATVLFILLPLFTGTWLFAFLSHIGKVRIWLIWTIWIIVWFVIVIFLNLMWDYSYAVTWRDFEGTFSDFTLEWIWIGKGSAWPKAVVYMPAQIIALLLGLLPGMGIDWIRKKFHSLWWRNRYRLKRRLRTQ